MPPSRTRLGLAAAAAAGLGILAAWLPPASAGQGRAAGHAGIQEGALQVLADVVLIESRCRSLTVDYGRLFAFAEGNGIQPVDIMPTGPRRPAFEAAFRARSREAGVDQLCGPLAADRAAVIPGLFSAR